MLIYKEEKLRNSEDSKFSHLKDDLHIEITAFAPPAEAHARIAYALTEVRRFLVPVSYSINFYIKLILFYYFNLNSVYMYVRIIKIYLLNIY